MRWIWEGWSFTGKWRLCRDREGLGKWGSGWVQVGLRLGSVEIGDLLSSAFHFFILLF